MKRYITILSLSFAALTIVPGVIRAQTITTWTFNSPTPDANTATGTTTPSTGAGTLTLQSGVTNTFAGGSPGDTTSSGDNSGLNTTTYPAQGTNGGAAGVQFAVSTAGFADPIQISLDFRQSGTASRYFQLLVSTDGITFAAPSGGTTSIGTIGAGNTLTSFTSTGLYTNNSGGGSQTFVQGITYTLPAGSGYANDPNFAFRWVAVYDPNGATDGNGSNYISSNAGTTAAYTTAGTARFDDVTVSSVPEPATVFAGVLLVGVLGWHQRRRLRTLVAVRRPVLSA